MHGAFSRRGATPACYFKQWSRIAVLAMMLIFLLTGALILLPRLHVAHAQSDDWPTYQDDYGRSGFNSAETIINPSSAPRLKLHWSYKAGGAITTQPVEANGMIYWGSWDGFEHATNLDGTQAWQTNLGQTVDSSCHPPTAGVTSTATVASVLIGGTLTSVVFVGGGNATFYALNAATGAVIWNTPLGPSPSTFLWDSPAVYNNSVYIGVSSFGDCPLVQGQLVQLDASTGTIQHIFDTVPAGCLGAGVWGSPTIDASDGSVYFVTGNSGSCSTREVYASAIVKLSATDLTYLSSWRVPPTRRDFGSTPTLFQATINGVMHQLVGVANKNGIYYAFDRGAISNGPVWQATIAVSGGCPECGQGSISPSSWDGTALYVAGGHTTIGGNSCLGSLRALNPADGTFLWEDCLNDGAVLAAVSAVPGVAVVGEGTHLVVVATATGQILFNFAAGKRFWGAASISNGVLYIGDVKGNLYAFGT
jgi:outer membrane protein assembly factor BamB